MLHWAVIGIGDITTKRVIPAILDEPRSVLYGIVTRHPEKAAGYPGVTIWTDLAGALADPRVDAVYVASPVFLHGPQSIASMRAGKHVLCEKPMAMNYEQAEAMVRSARDCGVSFGIAYYRRLYPKVQRARQLIDQGAIGRPVLAEMNCHDWFAGHESGRGWLVDPNKSGGGPLYDIASHRIDLLNYFFGRPDRVTGMLSDAIRRLDVEDSATVLIEYENGVRGIVDVRWHSRVYRDEFRVIGVDGEIEMSPLNGPELVSPLGVESIPAPRNLHYPCIENFVSSVFDGAPMEATGASSLWTDWVTERVKA